MANVLLCEHYEEVFFREEMNYIGEQFDAEAKGDKTRCKTRTASYAVLKVIQKRLNLVKSSLRQGTVTVKNHGPRWILIFN
jgi:hypothetical protein